ncbi:MAG TPA: phage tail tape measure protein, partial [Caldilineaceae bacterium]|nr:phage tail tape measure protein [Caldilineaceae bacterium]
MTTMERLVVELATDATEYHRGLNQASQSTSSWGGKLAGIAGKAALGAMAAAGAAIAGVGAAGVKEFVGFQNSMNEVFTLLPGITGEAMGKMQEDVKGFAKEFGVLPKETVPALYQALSAGVPKDNVFNFLEIAQKAARGGVTDLETAVDGISSTVNAYGADIMDASKASDLMFTAVKLGKTTFEELSANLFNVNPTAAALGVEFGNVTAALAAMTAQGVPTSVATTQLRQLFVEMSKEGSKTADVFQEIAGKSFRQFVAEGGNTQDALKLLEQYAASTGVGINDLFGSVEAGNAALALTGKGTEAFGSALAQMGTATGATEAAFEQMNQGIGPQLEKLKVAWNVMLVDVGTKAEPAFSMLVGAAEKALPVVGEWFVWMADKAAIGVQWIQANWPAIAATVQSVVDRVAGVLSGVLGPSLGNAQGTFAWVTDWVRDNLPLMRKTVETVVGAITQFWDANGERIMAIVRGFMSVVAKIFDTYLKNAFDVVKVIMQLITGDFEGAGETLRGIAERTFRAIFEIIGTYLEMVKSAISGIDWGALGRSIVEGIANGLRGAGGLLVEAAKGAAQGALDGVKGLLG